MTREAIAMVFEGPGRPFQARQLPLPHLQSGEAVVRLLACTLCGSDLHTYDGRRTEPTPTILGHEMVGRIEDLADDGSALDYGGRPLCVGDRVVWSVCVPCGTCYFCHHQLPQKCVHIVKYGHVRLDGNRGLHGGLATHCHLLPGTAVFRVPNAIPDKVACPAGCATATVMATLRQAGDTNHAVVLILGAGMLGLTATACIRASTTSATVVVADTNADRLALAREFGADQAFQVDEQIHGLRASIAELSGGRGVDVAIDLSGAPAALALGAELLRVGGRFIWAGSVFPTAPAPFAPEIVVRKLLTIRGVHNYHPDDLADALCLLEDNQTRFPFERLVGEAFPLAEVERAFRHALEHRPIRVAISMNEGWTE